MVEKKINYSDNNSTCSIQSIFQTKNVGVVIFKASGEFVDINSSAATMLGVNDKNSIHTKGVKLQSLPFYNQLLNSDGSLSFNIPIEYYCNFDSPSLHMFPSPQRSGKAWFIIKIYPFLNEKEELNNIVLTVTDITMAKIQIDLREQINNDMAELMRSNGMFTWLFDVETKKRTNMHGFPLFPKKYSDDDYPSMIHPNDVHKMREILFNLKSGIIQEMNEIIRFKNIKNSDEYNFMDITCRARYKDKKIVYIACAAKDVTALTEYQQSLEINKARLELAMKAGNIVRFEYDVVNDMVYPFNDPMFPDCEQIPMKEYEKLFNHGDSATIPLTKIRAGMDAVISAQFKMKKESETQWHDMSFNLVPVKRDSNGRVTLYTGLRKDDSKMARLINGLEDVNTLFRTVIDRLPCMFFLKDINDDFRYVTTNDMFAEYVGRPQQFIEGCSDFDLFSDTKRAKNLRYEDIKTAEEGSSFRKERTTFRGAKVVLHTIKSVININKRKLLLGICLDVSALEDTLILLEDAKERAEEADKQKSVFLATLSHEIRTPLNAIIGFSDLLVTSEDAVERKQFSSIVTKNGELLLNLINEVLDLSKIETSHLAFKNKVFDVTSLIEELRLTYSPKMSRSVELLCESPFKSCVINFDPDRFKQVINNFMTNAIKYTPDGYIKLGYNYSDGVLTVYVKDSGIGISEENKHRVFGRFNKLDNYAQGTGLGLYICKVIAQKAGGDVGFESIKGVGSTFYMSLPIEAHFSDENQSLINAEVQKIEVPELTEEEKGKIKILVAEDNESNFELMQSILKGYDISWAKNGYEAVDMTIKNNYSMILMDMTMPIVDGIEATQKIRKLKVEIPIIMMTANIFNKDEKAALEAGASQYLIKPIRNEDILRIVRDYTTTKK